MSVQLQKHYFNVDEYYRMARAGVFSEGQRVELIEGEVIETSPIGSTHQGCVDELSSLIAEKLGASVIVRVQGAKLYICHPPDA